MRVEPTKSSNKNLREIEIWADSFKEGEFILEQINQVFSGGGISYEFGFLPSLTISINSQQIKFTAFGYYSAWSNIPTKISELLKFGKCDAIIYDPNNDKIIFAYEETSAVPTGNQSLQRLERVWFAAKSLIPFVYLISKFGLHIDGGIRTISIWPSYLALKLSAQYKIPSLTLLYGNEEHPEDYSIGNSSRHLRQLLKWFLENHLSGNSDTDTLRTLLSEIYKEMCEFIYYHSDSISENLVGKKQLIDKNFYKFLTELLLDKSSNLNFDSDLKWPNSSKNTKTTTISFDKFILNIEKLIEQNKAWWPINGATTRTEPNTKMSKWIKDQKSHKSKLESKSKSKLDVEMTLNDFPDQNSKKKITTTCRILILINNTQDFLQCFEKAFGIKKCQNIEKLLDKRLPVVLYVSNSIHSNGRAFKGDPFTGQITAYSRIFSISLTGKKERNMIAYYPNQLYSQFFDKDFGKLDNKGIKCLEENIDLIITRNGICIDPKCWRLS